jgi:hypothetical protein
MSPPEAPMIRTLRPARAPPEWNSFKVSQSVPSVSQRAMPACRQKASNTPSAPASAPVWLCAVRAAAAVRPDLITAIGLPARRALSAARAKRSVSLTPSRYRPKAVTRGSSLRISMRSSTARRVWLPTENRYPIGTDRSLKLKVRAIVPLWQIMATPRSTGAPTT